MTFIRTAFGRAAFLAFIIFCPVLAGLQAQEAGGEAALERAEEFIAGLDEADAPGCAVGAMNLGDREWIYQDAYGQDDLQRGIANTPATIFGVASVTKQFTAAAAAIADHQGYLSLEDDIRRYLPEMPDYGTPITILDLIYHTDGLRDIVSLVPLTGREGRYADRTSRIRLLARQRALNYQPGTEYRYGNSGYLLLTEIITRATGKPIAEYIEANIFRPLGMRDSYLGVYTRGSAGRAVAYSQVAGRWREDLYPMGGPAAWGYSGLMTTLEDYGRWAANLVADESRLAGGSALTTRLRTPGPLGRDNPAAFGSYGFGLGLDPYRGLHTISHGGSGYGYKAFTMIFPQPDLGVFGFCNNGHYAYSVVMGLADIFLALEAEEAAGIVPTIQLTRAQLERFGGTYREPRLRLPMVVEPRSEGLLIRGDVQPYLWEPVSNRRFRNEDNVLIEFSFSGESGSRVRYLQQLEGRNYGTGRFERIEPVMLTERELVEYAGDYYSEDLDATYRFGVQEGRLCAHIVGEEAGGISPFVFQPMLRDEFVDIPNRFALRFDRRNEGTIGSLVLTNQFGWITDVEFTRLEK